MSETYRKRVAAALDDYERITTNRPDATRFDIEDPAVRELYRRFARKPLRLPGSAALPQWWALHDGLKPLVRELMPRALAARRVEETRAEGWVAAMFETPVSTDPHHGMSVLRPPDATDVEVLFYAGRDEAALADAARIDRELLSVHPPEHTARLTQELGERLGYPSCCVQAYVDALGEARNRDVIARAAARTEHFEPLLNNVALGAFHFIGWFPCRYDCPASLGFAAALEPRLHETPTALQGVRRLLAMPRIYIDDRRQLIISGRVEGERVVFEDIHTPYAFDRNDAAAAFEWVFYREEVAPLLQGNGFELRGQQLELFRDDEPLARRRLDGDAVWLPFAHRG